MKRPDKFAINAAIAVLIFAFVMWLGNDWLQRQQDNRAIGYLAWIATIDYTNAHHGRLPDASDWEDALRANWERKPRAYPFRVTLSPGFGSAPRRLAMNSRLSGVSIREVGIHHAAETVLYYEVDSASKNAAGAPPTDILSPPIGRVTSTYVCMDGRISNPIP